MCVPAVSDDGSGIRRVAGFHPAEEVEEGGGILWHAVIWPSCKLELTNLSPLAAATLIWQKQAENTVFIISELITVCLCTRVSSIFNALLNIITIFSEKHLLLPFYSTFKKLLKYITVSLSQIFQH